jgi:hypothetical protein
LRTLALCTTLGARGSEGVSARVGFSVVTQFESKCAEFVMHIKK